MTNTPRHNDIKRLIRIGNYSLSRKKSIPGRTALERRGGTPLATKGDTGVVTIEC